MRLRRTMSCLALVAAVLAGCVGEGTTPPAPVVRRPRLAVVLVVDQMRADYLTRYADLYRGGLARLRREGAWFIRAQVQHARTFTAPGHASVATGNHPARHGIVANDWYSPGEQREVYASEDPQVRATLAGPRTAELPGCSPAQLQRPGLGDWLKAQEPAARVFSVALKDRSAVMMGGHGPDRAYWYGPEVAGFVSSSWYQQGAALPGWVAAFNASGAAYRRFTAGWTRLRDPSAYLRSGPDRVATEADGRRTEFPHSFDDGSAAARAGFAKDLMYTPFGDELALSFARALVTAEGLGADEVPDLLLVSCSSADLIGHRYGPHSHEIEDYYLRLDGYLAELLALLDQQVGKDGYVLALTADHGALPLPEEARLQGFHTARRVPAELYRAQVSAVVGAALHGLGLPADTLRFIDGDGLWLDGARASAAGVRPAALHAAVAGALRTLDFVADAFTAESLAGPPDQARPFLGAYQRSYFAGRSPDVQLRFKEWHLVDARPQGTSHGSPYGYDTDVPLLFFGAGVRPGMHERPVGTVDLAPTLAALLGLRPPAGVDGTSLAGVIMGGSGPGAAGGARPAR